MPRYKKMILWGCLGLILVIVLIIVLAASFNWNHAKPWINRQASELAGRPVAIEGDLSVKWLRPAKQSGWRGWLLWPQITAQQITVGNPQASKLDVNMAEIKNLTVVLNPLALLDDTIQIPSLKIDAANVRLDRDAQGVNNWTFKQAGAGQPSSRWKFDLQSVQVSQARVRVIDAANQLDLDAELDSLEQAGEKGYGMGFKASGSYNKAAITGQGQSGGILSLQAGSNPFPLQGEVKVGETTIAIEGVVTKPQQLASLDVRLKLAGDSMADLYALTGVALPNTPPYSTEGRLIGLLEGDDDTWRYENFKGVVGESDVAGNLKYQVRKPRSLLTGQVQSKLLRFKDLGPLIGADTSDVKTSGKRKDKVKQPANKALPVSPIGTRAWGAMDADVKFSGLKILRDKDLPLDNIDAHVKLDDRVLALTPLNFGFAGGTLSNTITLDGRSEKIQAEMITSARHLKLKKLFPGAESMNASFGELHGDAKLKGRGNSVAELLGHANGEIKALVSKGTISHFLLEAAGLNVANMVVVKLFGDEQVVLNCVATDFGVTDGLMRVRTFKLETEDMTVDVSGEINLRTEKMDLEVRPENKTLRIFTLRSPLYVKGSFKKPDVGVEVGPLAARAGAAVALGVIATPFAALLPLLNVGTNESNDCAPLVSSSGSDKPAQAKPKNAKPNSDRENWPSSQAKP